jgi:predicted DNA-binding transcriptional regulator YafY
MPTNFDAVLRYHTIDQCLQNRYRTWTWEDLAEKCTDAIINATGNLKKDSISKRTIQNDIKIMRSNILGYEAPIGVRNGGYFYEDPGYSIRNATVSQADIKSMAAAIKMFKTYKGLEFFTEVETLINKLEKQVHLKTYSEVQKIECFEQVPQSCGQEKVNSLMAAILSKQALKLSYKKYNTEEVKSYIFHPYFLKEYHNRWYILGWFDEGKYIKTFALDRITGFEAIPDVEYIEQYRPDEGRSTEKLATFETTRSFSSPSRNAWNSRSRSLTGVSPLMTGAWRASPISSSWSRYCPMTSVGSPS